MTLVEPHSGERYVQHPRDQRAIPGTYESLFVHFQQGDPIVIASNQRGVSEGHKTLNAAIMEMHYCMTLFSPMIRLGLFCPDKAGNEIVIVDQLQFHQNQHYTAIQVLPQLQQTFPHLRLSAGFFRKPGPGMLYMAMHMHKIRPPDVIMIGDKETDRMAAENAGVAFHYAPALT